MQLIMQKILLISIVLFPILFAKGQNNSRPEGVIIKHIDSETQKYIGSPSICILPNGDYVVSHDEFGPKSREFESANTYIYRSKDKGLTWQDIAQINGQFWSNLFLENDTLYIMGTNKHHGNLVIRRSTDGGETWTIPYDADNGLILEGEYHTAPVPVVIRNGMIWRAVEYATAKTTEWGKRYSAMVISAPVGSDLLHAANWTKTNRLPYNENYLDGHFSAWLEGNAVVGPQGDVLNVLRVNQNQSGTEKIAVARVVNETTLTFTPDDFYTMPGGSKKFTIRYDESSKKYWTIANDVPPAYADKNPHAVRNHLVLMSSDDLKNWQIRQVLLAHPDSDKHGFQYADWVFDGNDILFVSRTAFDDDKGGANNYHDANYLTFHRIKNFRKSKSANGIN